jgi:hypothetical protein
VLKRGLACAALAVALVFPALAGAGEALAPGITHEQQLLFSAGRPVVLHVVRTPPPGDLYRLRPVLSGGTVLGGKTVPRMQAQRSSRATAVGVNGDFFHLKSGNPSGLFLRDGVLATPPHRDRSAIALGLDGRLLVDLFRLAATWRAGAGAAHRLHDLNRPVAEGDRVGLFTDSWGGPTPHVRRSVEIVLARLPTTRLDTELTGTVVGVARGGRTVIPRGGAVLQARGAARGVLQAEAPVGATVTVQLGVEGLPTGTLDGIGGGPVLVRDGIPVRRPGEQFTHSHLTRRHPRTAVGQLANGGLLFVVADGRSSRSFGLTTWALARTMADLGAVTAMSFDGGGSSTLAFDGRVLNTPADGRPRSVATGLFVEYYGVYAPAVGGRVFSPNGDGVGDSKVLRAKVVRPSTLRLRLLRPNGSVAWSRQEAVGPGWYERVVRSPAMADGRWRWVVEATDTTTGEETQMTRSLRVNKTLGHLELSRERVRVRARKGRLRASVRLSRPATLRVDVRDARGRVRRVLFAGQRSAGKQSWRWNGRTTRGRIVPAGTYAVRVAARNALGEVTLRRSVRVVRRGPR